MWMLDSLKNLVSGLGTWKDPTTASRYHFHELNRNELTQAYRSNWVARRVVDAPSEDASREWRDWQASQDQIEKIESLEKQYQLQKKFKDVLIRARLYGGAALVMGVEGGGEVWEEIDLDLLGPDCLKFIVVLNRYELSAGPRIYDAESPFYTRPEYYTISTPMVGFDLNNPSGDPAKKSLDTGVVRIHPSRVIEFSGNPLPDWRLATLGAGWGDSVIQMLDEHLKDFGLSVGSVANMLNDSKIDVISLPGLSKNLSSRDQTSKLFERFTQANMGKSTLNALLIDKEETWQRVQTSFGGISDVLRIMMTIVSAGAGIPMSRLMGSSPGKGLGGESGGGDSDLRNYYDDIMSKQRVEYGPIMAPLDNVLQISALGSLDESIYYDWAPLYKPDPKDVAMVNLQKSQAFQIDAQLGLINPDALRTARINQLIEDQVYPGLDDAIEEHGAEPDEPEVGPEDVQAHMQMLSQSTKELQSYGQMAQKALPKPTPAGNNK